MTRPVPSNLTVGVLALQGSFHEHAALLKQAAANLSLSIAVVFVRTVEELQRCHGLVIPGGESTTITLLAHKNGGALMRALRRFVSTDRRPVYGTCAGMICLSRESRDLGMAARLAASKGKDKVADIEEAQDKDSIGGLDIAVVRNQYGRQLASFEHPLEFTGLRDPSKPFTGVFIRAPIVHHILPPSTSTNEPVEVLASVPAQVLPRAKSGLDAADELGPDASAVALRQGNMLVTSFHPELTSDTRVHEFFLEQMVIKASAECGESAKA